MKQDRLPFYKDVREYECNQIIKYYKIDDEIFETFLVYRKGNIILKHYKNGRLLETEKLDVIRRLS